MRSDWVGTPALASNGTDLLTVVRAAKEHEIQLEPEQVILHRTGTAEAPILSLAADYNARVKLPGYSFTLHFTPSSAR